MGKYKAIIYDEDNLFYMSGDFEDHEIEMKPLTSSCRLANDIYEKQFLTGYIRTLKINGFNSLASETIELDPTMMKRILKYNKEQEIQKLNIIIAEKERKIQELDELLSDKEARWEKVKKYIANIYDLDLEEDSFDEDYFE